MRYAIVINGVVANIVIWDGEAQWAPEQGAAIACPDEVGIGWTYDGEFAAPETPAP